MEKITEFLFLEREAGPAADFAGPVGQIGRVGQSAKPDRWGIFSGLFTEKLLYNRRGRSTLPDDFSTTTKINKEESEK